MYSRLHRNQQSGLHLGSRPPPMLRERCDGTPRTVTRQEKVVPGRFPPPRQTRRGLPGAPAADRHGWARSCGARRADRRTVSVSEPHRPACLSPRNRPPLTPRQALLAGKPRTDTGLSPDAEPRSREEAVGLRRRGRPGLGRRVAPPGCEEPRSAPEPADPARVGKRSAPAAATRHTPAGPRPAPRLPESGEPGPPRPPPQQRRRPLAGPAAASARGPRRAGSAPPGRPPRPARPYSPPTRGLTGRSPPGATSAFSSGGTGAAMAQTKRGAPRRSVRCSAPCRRGGGTAARGQGGCGVRDREGFAPVRSRRPPLRTPAPAASPKLLESECSRRPFHKK